MVKAKMRGAGQPPREYSTWEWARAYIALVLTFPIYLALWLFATLCPQLPAKWLAVLQRSHSKTTAYRARDVRIPGDESVGAYMLRWWKIPRNWAFNIYYHVLLRSDEDIAHHDHPWWNFSIVLEGGYYEHTISQGGVHRKVWYGPGAVRFRPWGGFAHRLELATELDDMAEQGNMLIREQPAKTIFITGPVLRRWGFHDGQRGFVDAYEWDDHCKKHGLGGIRMSGYAEQNAKGPN